MEVVMHPLFVAPLASVLTWLVCRWWYRGQVRALEGAQSREALEPDAHREARESDAMSSPPPPGGGAGDGAPLRLTSLGGRPVLPFLDTSPLSHFAEPEPDLFGHVAATGVGDRPYLN